MKKCNKCHEIKLLSDFSKRKDSKDGYRNECKSCRSDNPNQKEQNRKYYQINRIYLLDKSKIRKASKINPNSKRRVIKTLFKECLNDQSVCIKCLSIKNTSEFIKDKTRKNGLSAYCNSCKNEYFKIKRDSDLIFKLSSVIRSMISSFTKSNGLSKTKSSEEILGCDFLQLKLHLESNFSDGMSWLNYGDWHIDHVIPISYAKSEDDVYRLNHYTNLQPLWAKDNLSKGNRFIG